MKKKDIEHLTEDEIVALIAESVMANVEEGQKQASDPFELYTYAIVTKIFGSSQGLKQRCQHGYQALIHEVQTM